MSNATYPEPLWDDKQLAKFLNVSARTPASWRLHGGGPPCIRVGNRPRYDPVAVRAWIEKHTHDPDAEAPKNPHSWLLP